MDNLIFYKRDPRAFLEATIGMEYDVRWCYSVLLDLLYINKGKLRDDGKYIAGNLGCSVQKWGFIRAKLIEKYNKLVVDGDYLVNDRTTLELGLIKTRQKPERKPKEDKPKPLKEPKKATKKPDNQHETDIEFLEFYELYEKKIGPVDSFKSFDKCREKYGFKAIMECLEEAIKSDHRFQIQKPPEKPHQFRPMPTTWLNALLRNGINGQESSKPKMDKETLLNTLKHRINSVEQGGQVWREDWVDAYGMNYSEAKDFIKKNGG